MSSGKAARIESSVIDPSTKDTLDDSGRLLFSEDNKLSTMTISLGSMSSSCKTKLEPTKPAPPTTSYKVVKLTNGEEIICQLGDDIDNGEYKINFPLKMEVHSVLTKEGPVDSLNLSRWIGPYTEQSLFLIKSDHVLLVANASPGLSRYYEHVRKQIIQVNSPKLDDITNEEVYEDLLTDLEIEDTIH